MSGLPSLSTIVAVFGPEGARIKLQSATGHIGGSFTFEWAKRYIDGRGLLLRYMCWSTLCSGAERENGDPLEERGPTKENRGSVVNPVRDDKALARERLRARVAEYLEAHHTMTVATVAPERNAPHAACVFYAVDAALRLVFLSKLGSAHGTHISEAALVAVTVAEDYEDWEMIQGVQLWGEARLLSGTTKARAFALYLKRFPFVRDLRRRPGRAALFQDIGVYRITPQRVAFTDNTTGVFGREILDLTVE